MERKFFTIDNNKKEILIIIQDKLVRVIDCKDFKRKHIKEIVDKIYDYTLEYGYLISRSRADMCGELYLHTLCAKIGLFYNSTKDADLEYDQDRRWLVRFCSKILSILF